MKSAAIIPTLQSSDVIINCITSMIAGGYDGDIYVVSRDPSCIGLVELSDKVRYVSSNNPELESSDSLIHKGFLAFDKEYDLIVFAHNDVTFQSGWWQPLNELWDSVDKTRVWSINVPQVTDKIAVSNPEQKLGLGYDPFNPVGIGRYTPCTTFLYDFYAEVVAKYNGDTCVCLEQCLNYESIVQHKWQFLANTGSYITHHGGIDSRLMDSLEPNKFYDFIIRGYKYWHETFGTNVEHFITVWFGIVMMNHVYEIIDCANDNNYEALDYICDEGLALFNNHDCKSCSLKCMYVNRINVII